jgi:hypothetical protein
MYVIRRDMASRRPSCTRQPGAADGTDRGWKVGLKKVDGDQLGSIRRASILCIQVFGTGCRTRPSAEVVCVTCRCEMEETVTTRVVGPRETDECECFV